MATNSKSRTVVVLRTRNGLFRISAVVIGAKRAEVKPGTCPAPIAALMRLKPVEFGQTTVVPRVVQITNELEMRKPLT